MQERRKFVRFRASCLVRFGKGFASGAQGIVKDMSMGGMCVIIDRSVALDSNCIVRFHVLLPDKTFEIFGKSVWVHDAQQGKEIGIQFACLCDDFKEDIYAYISKYYRKELLQRWWSS